MTSELGGAHLLIEDNKVVEEEDIITTERNIAEDIIEKNITVTRVEEHYRKNLTLKTKITTTENISERTIKRTIFNGLKGKISDDDSPDDYDDQSEREIKKGPEAPRCFVSKGERVIADYLRKNNIKFISQKRYKECRYKHPLPFDFYIPRYNLLLEYDGKQHFTPDGKMVTVEDFDGRVVKDTIKLKYAIKNNLTLLRISYLETEQIPEILDEVLKNENLSNEKFLFDIKSVCNEKVLTHYQKQLEDASKIEEKIEIKNEEE